MGLRRFDFVKYFPEAVAPQLHEDPILSKFLPDGYWLARARALKGSWMYPFDGVQGADVRITWKLPGYVGANTANTIYADTHYYFILIFEDKPVASLGFEISEDKRNLYVLQIQGRRGHYFNFHWARALLHYATDWAFRTTRVQTVYVRSGFCNFWCPVQLEGSLSKFAQQNTEMRHRLFMTYDVTAKKLKFVPSPEQHRLEGYSHRCPEPIQAQVNSVDVFSAWEMTKNRWNSC